MGDDDNNDNNNNKKNNNYNSNIYNDDNNNDNNNDWIYKGTGSHFTLRNSKNKSTKICDMDTARNVYNTRGILSSNHDLVSCGLNMGE